MLHFYEKQYYELIVCMFSEGWVCHLYVKNYYIPRVYMLSADGEFNLYEETNTSLSHICLAHDG